MMAAYGTNVGFSDWVTSMGLTLPAGANLDALRAVGSAYVDGAYEHRLSCSARTGGFTQELAWPRTGHYVNCQEVPSDLIPQAWVNASYRAAYLQASQPGWATASNDPNRKTKREKVDVIEREYFDADKLVGTADVAAGMAADGVINGLVSVWLCPVSRRASSLFRVI